MRLSETERASIKIDVPVKVARSPVAPRCVPPTGTSIVRPHFSEFGLSPTKGKVETAGPWTGWAILYRCAAAHLSVED